MKKKVWLFLKVAGAVAGIGLVVALMIQGHQKCIEDFEQFYGMPAVAADESIGSHELHKIVNAKLADLAQKCVPVRAAFAKDPLNKKLAEQEVKVCGEFHHGTRIARCVGIIVPDDPRSGFYKAHSSTQ